MNRINEKILWYLALAMVFAAYFFGLFIDLTGDSGLYAAITRQMVESGNWFNLQINGEAYDQKPHLLFWLAGLGVKCFGNTNFAFKLFPAIYGGFTFYFVYRLGTFLYSKKTGKVAALVLASSQISFLYFLDIHTDTILQTGVVLAIWQLLVYLQKNRIINFVFGFAGVGLAMLAKGPVGGIIPFFTVLVYLIVSKNYRQLFSLKWLFGVGISLLIISPTLIHLYKSFGFEGIKFFFITNNFGRISGEYAGSSIDPFYYLYNFVWAFLPFSFLAVVSVVSELKTWKMSELKNASEIALIGSVLVFLVILSVAKGKGPNYFLPVFSVFALFSAKEIQKISAATIINSVVKTQKIILVLLGVFFAAIFFWFESKTKLIPVGFALLVFALLVYMLKFSKHLQMVSLFSVLVFGAINLYANLNIIPSLFAYQGARQALAVFDSKKKSDSKFYNLHLEEYELFFYAKEKVIEVQGGDEYYKMLADKNAWVYTTESGYSGIRDNISPDTVFVILQRGMNKVNFEFLNHKTRDKSLEKNYLIKLN